MNTHLGKVEQRLKLAGCTFYKSQHSSLWVCELEGQRLASEATKPLCITKAAKALGEAV